jgi:hypothetical protein
VDGKGQEEIKAEINKVYSQLVIEFRSTENGKRIRRRVEDDLSSVSNFGSIDAGTQLQRYFQRLPDDPSLLEPPDNGTAISWDAPTISLIDAARTRDRELVSSLIANVSKEYWTRSHFLHYLLELKVFDGHHGNQEMLLPAERRSEKGRKTKREIITFSYH